MIPDSQRATGCLPRTDRCGDTYPVFEDGELEIIPRARWAEVLPQTRSIETLVSKIKDQGQEGTCASNATCQGLEIAWNMTFGKLAWVEFSPISIYRWIAPGPDSGSTISDNLDQLRSVGALPVDKPETRDLLKRAGLNPAHVLRPTGYSQSFPSDWKDTAEVFRGLEYFDIASMEGFVSALAYGFPVIAGRDGHAICYVQAILSGKAVKLRYANSWGDWGDNGYGEDPESKLAAALNSYGAWALRGVDITDTTLTLVEETYKTKE